MKCKEILKLDSKRLEEIMTEKEYDRMREIGMEYVWELLDTMQDGVRESGLDDEDEYITISEYLDYLEEMKEGKEE